MISHGVWGTTIVRRPKLLVPAFISGLLPDLISTVAGFFYLQITQGPNFVFVWSALPTWSRVLYGYSHGLLGLAIFSSLIIIFTRRYWILIYPYAFHIFLDLFTHSGDPFVSLFYPLLDYNSQRLWGWNWFEHPLASVINWTLLIIINIGLIVYYRRKKLKLNSIPK